MKENKALKKENEALKQKIEYSETGLLNWREMKEQVNSIKLENSNFKLLYQLLINIKEISECPVSYIHMKYPIILPSGVTVHES